MKKVIFTIIFTTSLFAATGLALANNTPENDPLGEIWTAINDLRNQIASLKSYPEPKAGEEMIYSDRSITVVREIPVKKIDKDIPQSEHYVMKGLTF